MSKFYVLMKRDKAADMIGYAHPVNLVSVNYDPDLYAKATAMFSQAGFPSVEAAENTAREMARALFIYDHTKRPKVLKDFRIYRWWILDAEKPVQVWCGCYHYGSRELDRGEFKTLAQLYPKDNCYGLKDAIAKKGKIDFSKEKDPSNGAIAKRAKEENARIEAELRDQRNYVDTYCDEALHGKNALDLIPSSSKRIKNFHKDSLNLLSEYCFVYPTKGCYYSGGVAQEIGVEPNSRKKVWACSVSRCCYEKEAQWKERCSEMYKASINVFATKEEAILHAALLGFQRPQVFDDFKLPSYAKRLVSYIEGVGGMRVFPAEVYRCMVLDGVMQPIKKFMKK